VAADVQLPGTRGVGAEYGLAIGASSYPRPAVWSAQASDDDLRQRDDIVLWLAQGVLMARHGVDAAGAMEMIAELTQLTRRPVREIAFRIVRPIVDVW